MLFCIKFCNIRLSKETSPYIGVMLFVSASESSNSYPCDQHILQVMDVNVPIALINRTFIQNGLEVSEAHMCEDTLEDYFKQVTGGEGIA